MLYLWLGVNHVSCGCEGRFHALHMQTLGPNGSEVYIEFLTVEVIHSLQNTLFGLM